MSSRLAGVVAMVFALGGALPAEAACVARPVSTEDLAQCSSAASNGDGLAARLLGDALSDPASRLYDPATALSWWEQAAAAGDDIALRRLFDASWYGRGTARDTAKARAYLIQAAGRGAVWARLVRALLAEGDEPALAAELYTALAAEGNCLAQLRLAHGHDRGGWLEKNRSQALYWATVAGSTQERALRSDDHPLFESRFHYRDCATESFFLREELARGLAPDLKGKVEASAASWRPGRIPERQGPVEVPAAIGIPPAGLGANGVAAPKLAEWRPLPASLQRPAGRAKVGAEEVFASVGRSVYVVVAARTEEDVKAGRVRYGSAVAMDERTLVTNCHVIDELAVITLRRAGQTMRASAAGGDGETDRCLLTVSPGRLSAVPGTRAWDDLKVGETVYSIGAPKGLEATLGQGLVSGLRVIKGVRYVQTSAPISPGSSGGGLFDAAGNLVAITTFHIRDADGLNFAIAAEEYFR